MRTTKAERDELRCSIHCTCVICGMLDDIDELRAALTSYGRHKSDCKVNPGMKAAGFWPEITPQPCTCGLDAALEDPQ